MTKNVVILQPQYIPWVGVFEQIRLADIYVHYDDVQFPRGASFTNRVQYKHPDSAKLEGYEAKWLTVPVLEKSKMLPICQTRTDNAQQWQRKHLAMLKHAYAKAPFAREMLELFEDIVLQEYTSIAALNMRAIEQIADYFSLKPRFLRASELGVASQATERLVEICKKLGATHYITGMGAKNYVDYARFEAESIRLCYMDYHKRPYPQLHGAFTPYVTILDLIAHCGRAGLECIDSPAVYWKDANLKDESVA